MKSFIGCALLILLTLSCGKLPISGMAYLSSDSGIVSPVPHLKVLIISQAQFQAFLSERRQEALAQAEPLHQKLARAREEYKNPKKPDAATEAKETAMDNDETEKYHALLKEQADMPALVNSVTVALNRLVNQYGARPEILTHKYTQQQLNVFAQEEQYKEQLSVLRRRAGQLQLALESKEHYIQNRQQWKVDSAQFQGQINTKYYQEIMSDLSRLQSLDFYMDSFAPEALETIIANDKGEFSMRPLKKGEMLFAKFGLPGIKMYYWALTPNQGRLVLNDENTYKLPDDFKMATE